VSALEQRLVELGRELELPPEPDVASRARARARGKPFPWRAAAVAFAAVAAAVAIAFAVPEARSAILRWFHLGGASIELVDTLPQAHELPAAEGLGRPVPLSQAGRQVGFELVLPPLDRKPERAYVIGDSVASVLLQAHGKTVLLSEFPSLGGEVALKKLAVNATVIDPVVVRGKPGLWLEGAPHVLTWMDRDTGYRERPILVRGNVLLWLHDGLTLRLEGRLSKRQALELARSSG
jgi:hypothetical protein